ncbi:MAG TPA: DUF1415 domain-containing protein [Burkholderiales bacterium]|nr:DUF1415 domain-containing protein [Burkholderiales bacterium]
MMGQPGAEEVVIATRTWLERAVIGLNLCPFAKTVHLHDRIRYFVSDARSPARLLEDLMAELRALDDADPAQCETTLLIHPRVLADFIDYNDFLGQADDAVSELGLEGVIQVASFHPRYQFEDAGPDDIGNYTNRSPYPMLHLLRESSVERAVTTYPDATAIYRKNIDTLRRLGHEGWRRLWLTEAPLIATARQGFESNPINSLTTEDAEDAKEKREE